MRTFPQLLANGQLGALLLLTVGIAGILAQQEQEVDLHPSQFNSIANNWNKRMLMFNSDAFRNRRGWANNNNKDLEINSNMEVEGAQSQQRSARHSPTPTQATRSRSCYFTPIQCSLYPQKFNNVGSEGISSVVRPLMNSDRSVLHLHNSGNQASRKRQNALLRWRNVADSSRLRL